MKDGIDQYSKADLAEAEASLMKSLDLDPSSSTACYYRGLVAYAQKDYVQRRGHVPEGIPARRECRHHQLRARGELVRRGKNPDATKYLNFAKQADKAAYGDKVDALLKRIDTSK